MEGVKTRGEILRCAGERAGGLQMGGKEGRERSGDQRMGFSLKVLVLSRYSIVNKRVIFLICCARQTLFQETKAWYLLS